MFTRYVVASLTCLGLGAVGLIYSVTRPDDSSHQDYEVHVVGRTPAPVACTQQREGVHKTLLHLSDQDEGCWITCDRSQVSYTPDHAVIEEMQGIRGTLRHPLYSGHFTAKRACFAYNTSELTAYEVFLKQGGHATQLTLNLDKGTGAAQGAVSLVLPEATICANQATFSQLDQTATFCQNVTIQTEQGSASGDVLHIEFETNGPVLTPQLLTLSGHVQLKNERFTATAQQAIYLPKESELCLTAHSDSLVTVQEGGVTRLAAPALVIDPNTTRAHGIGKVRVALDQCEISPTNRVFSRHDPPS